MFLKKLKLFEKIFHDEVWAIYIYHNDRFRLQKYALLKNKSQLPSDISYLELPDNHIFIKFKKRWKKYLESQNFDIAPFLNHTFDTLIPIPGKSQFIALIFTNSRNITFLYDKSIEQLAARILRKSGQILENTILYREVTQKSTQIRKLMDVTQKIISSLDSEKILDFLDNKTSQIDAQIAREQKLIELLKEYRTTLISEVVTGKIDVRGEV